MSISFIDNTTTCKEFGICDGPAHSSEPAKLSFDIGEREKWDALVSNYTQKQVSFAAIDHRLELTRNDGTMAQRCDALVYFTSHEKRIIIFIELKDRSGKNWKKKGDNQLRETIAFFERTPEARDFDMINAHIANKKHPKSNKDDMLRMKRFQKDTGHILTIGQTITIK
jgi:hypothetical protein